jgi:ABC-type glycerol-3-phosphate transport system substrate-binding protein
MSGPVLLWEHVGAGLVEPLDEHLADLDLDDFLPRLLEVNRWTGRAGDPLGAGPLLEVPVNCESYNLAYLPSVLSERGLAVPQTWDEYFAVARAAADGAVRGFAQRGRYALIVDSDHYVAFFEDEEYSERVGQIGYELPPAGPTGERRPNLWTWSLAMAAASRDKPAARDFITWAASKEFLLRSAGEGNMNPTRSSTWDEPAFLELTEPWGDFAAVSRRLLNEYATVLVTPTPHYREIALRWTEALREAYAGRDVGEALRAAAADAEPRFAA